jgi:hypothetical protein
MASLGVLNPRPTFLKYLTPADVFLATSFLELRKTLSCFWKDLCCCIIKEILEYQPCGVK